ncbi:late competence protein ComER [Halalkalibacter akibai]|uniref:Pyrroline-5-carboxylate reductase n=1 Tax=Halalkalibacter akibai (strain ATCC 43226 / DSM 21942 / CIP 109018 / JCM 9157 / 1139) TaxID=1236973 RepID=W4QMJ5_HALA3|nr:late competence protein ComER [Halalkalibacter akibai]GAE33340.1 late competence protein [Halalkalibacter akibai JCM 9157]
MKIGIIGTGSMGTILLESFIESGAISPNQLVITNRNRAKAEALKKRFPTVIIGRNAEEVAQEASVIFICTKPLQFPTVLQSIAPVLHPSKLLISITSPISVEQLEEVVNCKVARAIPSILNRALTGSSLLSFGSRCQEEDKQYLTSLMATISEPLEIAEDITRVSSDIVSCGPAFFSYMMQQFIDGAVRQTNISKEDATTLATNMMIGMGKLLEKGHYTLPTLQQRVCVPGGITGEGIKVLEAETGAMFDHLFQQTHAKYYEDQELITEAFSNKSVK